MSADKDARIAELERKLAEQQARIEELVNQLGYEAKLSAPKYGTEELNNLLAKAKEEVRKEAIPDGFVLVNIKLLKDASDSLKNYFLDIGWSKSDMSIMAELDAVINYSYKLQGETK